MPMKALIWIAAAFIAFFSETAQAQSTNPDKFSGKFMLPFCKAETGADYTRGICAGIIYTTFAFSGYFEDSDKKFCPPPTADVGQAMRVIISYLEARPDMQEANFALLTLLILHTTWPCPH